MDIERAIIMAAHKKAQSEFMDFPDYDPDHDLDLAAALTVLIGERVSDEVEGDELYDFLKERVQCQFSYDNHDPKEEE